MQLRVVRIRRAVITRGVDGFDEFMQGGEGKRCVEVIVHGVDEGLFGGVPLGRQGQKQTSGTSPLAEWRSRPKGGFDALEGFFRGVLRLIVEDERRAIGTGQDEHPHHIRIALREEVLDADHVAQRLGHLLAAKLQHAVVNPVAGKLFARVGFGLRDLVFVMREDQVVAAAVDIDLFTEFGEVHGRAFDVPAGTALAPRAIPGNFTGLGGFP